MNPPSIDAQDIINVLTQQRNSAQSEAAMQAAIAAGLQRRVAELEEKLKVVPETLEEPSK